ncbi:hypothetical protein E4U17_000563 [Claviceps sp. LM77 group G4]|nr:hypothetical protein E4U17_000563 [Claviceps sp. LM77 group G4]KAG6076023.1 hypothetical protein E4U16_003030 [Claviceps sp. LM84 group G4]
MPIPRRIARAKRDARAKTAKTFINKTVPAVLKSSARARRGVESVQLVIDPPQSKEEPPKKQAYGTRKALHSEQGPLPDHAEQQGSLEEEVEERHAPLTSKVLPPMSISIHACDTLEAASRMYFSSTSRSPPRVAVLNMASPLRPGGGVLTGATSQEESLCGRTTLYASLREDFYRLPDVGGLYTPDVLVLKSWDDGPMGGLLLAKSERFFIDVATCAMLRMPDVEGGKYADPRDEELVVRKMRAVMRMVRGRGVMKLVLGAWGCGAYGNPVGEIARAWARVLCVRGGRNGGCRREGEGEGWDGLEVVFAIKGCRMAVAFAREFGGGLTVHGIADDDEDEEDISSECDGEA